MGIFDFLKRKKGEKKEKKQEIKKVQKIDEGEKEKEIKATVQIAGKTTYDWKKDIIWEPILTEKGQNLAQTNTVVFKVNPRANSTEIKKAVEQIFNVKVEDVRTGNFIKRLRGKLKIKSLRPKFKKAYVKLAKGSKIQIFE